MGTKQGSCAPVHTGLGTRLWSVPGVGVECPGLMTRHPPPPSPLSLLIFSFLSPFLPVSLLSSKPFVPIFVPDIVWDSGSPTAPAANKPTMAGSKGNGQEGESDASHKLRSALLDPGFLPPQHLSQPWGHSAVPPGPIGLTAVIPTHSHSQAQNTRTPAPPPRESMGTGVRPSDTGRCWWWASRHPSICPSN